MRMRIIGLLIGVFLNALITITNELANAGYDIWCWTRDNAASYGYTARYEGYEWGGGWWDDNNEDNTPSCPPDGGASCEGPDCSGLVFKTWAMENSTGATGFYYWYIGDNVHGPYTSTAFRDGCSGACEDVCGSGTGNSCGSGQNSYNSTLRMDAFAMSGHIGLIWSEDSDGYDYILEAADNAAGTGIWRRNYRVRPEYDGIKRKYWSVSCSGP